MDYPFTLPGYPNLNLALRPNGFFSSTKILHDGVPMKRSKGVYPLTLSDGTTLELKIKADLDIFSPKIVIAGQTIEVLPPISPLWLVWAYLPITLMFFGGALGGLLGASGAVGTLSASAVTYPAGPKSSSRSSSRPYPSSFFSSSPSCSP